jgi:hypothetical protein
MEIAMTKIAFALSAIAVFLGLLLAHPIPAISQELGYYEEAAPLLTQEELDDLLAPIALYPDPLIAQILPAATFADEIDEAARYVRQYGRYARIDYQPWDVSVRAVAHYRDVLFMMDRRMEWTIALGQAYIDQPQDVMDAIQRLRYYAYNEGNLYSTPQQQVIIRDDYFWIEPASPQYVYVPVYDPDVVYLEPYEPDYPLITFSSAFIIGAWLSRDCDWRHHRVYYHGWRGGGWVGRSRPHISDRRGIYINRRASTISVNNRVLQRDTRRFREQLRTEPWRGREAHPAAAPATRPGVTRQGVVTRPKAGGRSGAATRAGTATRPGAGTTERRGRERAPATRIQAPAAGTTGGSVNIIPSTATPATGRERPSRQHSAPATSPTAPATQRTAPVTPRAAPAVREAAPAATELPKPHRGHRIVNRPGGAEVYRGRDVQKTQPPSQTGYGGYGTSRDATIYRERGESSRGSMRQFGRGGQAAGAPAAVTPRPAVTPARPAQREMPATVPPRAMTPPPSAAPRAATPPPTVTRPSPATRAPGGFSAPRSLPASRPALPAAPMQRR